MRSSLMMLTVALSIASFAGMLRLKSDVEQQVRERARLVAERTRLKEDKLVLQAELAYLMRPDRLRAFAKKRGMVEQDILQFDTMIPTKPAGGM